MINELLNNETLFYHGTNKDFEDFEFKTSYREGFLGSLNEVKCEAFFFTTDLKTALIFAKNREENFGGFANIKTRHLNVKKPLDLTGNFLVKKYDNINGQCCDLTTGFPISTKSISDEEILLMNQNHSYSELCKILGVDLIQEEIADYDEVYFNSKLPRKKYKYSTEQLLLLLDNPEVIQSIKEHGFDSAICQEGSFENNKLGLSVAVFDTKYILKVENKNEVGNKEVNNRSKKLKI